jgi:rare lipoprotein A
MTRARKHIRLAPALLAGGLALLAASAAVVALALPASAAAQSTGGAVAPEAQPRGGVALTARPHALLGRPAKVTGTVARRHRGRTVRIQRYDEAARRWRGEARAVVTSRGRFAARWRSQRAGALRLRATLTRRRSASVTTASPEVSVRVFRPAIATWYGPGLYGNRTACGQTLTPELAGVAHKTLPCGTQVEISYRGSSVVVPVVDRGPFVKGRTWDLTKATADALGFTGTARVGALVRP